MVNAGTWLYIKKHNQTGLMYFGKTVCDPLKYKGSGSYWSSHVKLHGNDVTTLWYEYFEDENLLVEFAELFSEFFDIVNATNNDGKKIWANLIPENGLMGGQNKGMSGPGVTFYGKKHKEESKRMMANFGNKNGMFNKKHTDVSIKKMKERHPDRSGDKNPFFGKKHKEKSKKYGNLNHMYGIGENHPKAKKCYTPLGSFATVKAAAIAHSLSDETIRKRLKSTEEKFKNYYYEEIK